MEKTRGHGLQTATGTLRFKENEPPSPLNPGEFKNRRKRPIRQGNEAARAAFQMGCQLKASCESGKIGARMPTSALLNKNGLLQQTCRRGLRLRARQSKS